MPEEKKLPDKLTGNFPIISQTGFDVLGLVRQYNALPVDSPRRKEIYEKIENLVNYEENWD